MTHYRGVSIDLDGTVTGYRSAHPGRALAPFTEPLDLIWIQEACDADLDTAWSIWDIQDGYGAPGVTAAYGWDFTAVRNSTPEAREVMYAIARRSLNEHDLLDILGVNQARTA